jgi:DNA-3-methyladenine glycosylase I
MPKDPSQDLIRCPWAGLDDALMLQYHDTEWGVPLHDDRSLFELLTLEGAQAGLSWRTVLARREGYRLAFDEFDISRVAAYGDHDVERIMSAPNVIRNRAKIVSTIGNARAVLRVQQELGSFDKYVWSYVGSRTLQHHFDGMVELPAKTEQSEALSIDLRRRGFRFIGPTICYAFMQSAGLINDHLVSCFRYDALSTH